MRKWLYNEISSDFDGLHVPEAVVQVVQVVHPDALVLAGDLVGGHGSAADGERQLLPLRHDRDHGVLCWSRVHLDCEEN